MLERARDFILRNARLLERRRFAAEFEDGSAAAVVTALAAYRNEDGGFGNALEPDKRDPASQPVDVQFALETMDAAGAFDRQLALKACDWLARASTPKGGVPFALASVNDFPHAPWWDTEANPPANTAAETPLTISDLTGIDGLFSALNDQSKTSWMLYL